MKRAKRLERARQLGVELLSVHAIRFQVVMQPLLILGIPRYPTVEEKIELADRAGITTEQVRNWFINARGRGPGGGRKATPGKGALGVAAKAAASATKAAASATKAAAKAARMLHPAAAMLASRSGASIVLPSSKRLRKQGRRLCI